MITLEQLDTLLPPERLEALAVAYQVDRTHCVRLPGPVVFLCLLNALLNHEELTLRLLEERYFELTGVHADHSSFGKSLARLDPDYFAAISTTLYHQLAPSAGRGTLRALRLRFADATTVSLSAKLLHFGRSGGNGNRNKARRQVKSVWELSAERWPNLLHVCKEKSESADSIALGKPLAHHSQPGDLWVFDKGCHGRNRLLDIHQQQAYFLTPWNGQNLQSQHRLYARPPEQWPQAAPAAEDPDCVVVGVEQATFGNRHDSAATRQKWASMPLVVVYTLRYERRSQSWKPLILLTNLPVSASGRQAGPYPWEELAQLYRQRWEIELFFKLVKQHLSFSHLLSRCENGIKILLYMTQIAAFLLLWYQRQTHIDRGWRSVKFWLAHDVRAWTSLRLLQCPLEASG